VTGRRRPRRELSTREGWRSQGAIPSSRRQAKHKAHGSSRCYCEACSITGALAGLILAAVSHGMFAFAEGWRSSIICISFADDRFLSGDASDGLVVTLLRTGPTSRWVSPERPSPMSLLQNVEAPMRCGSGRLAVSAPGAKVSHALKQRGGHPSQTIGKENQSASVNWHLPSLLLVTSLRCSRKITQCFILVCIAPI